MCVFLMLGLFIENSHKSCPIYSIDDRIVSNRWMKKWLLFHWPLVLCATTVFSPFVPSFFSNNLFHAS